VKTPVQSQGVIYGFPPDEGTVRRRDASPMTATAQMTQTTHRTYTVAGMACDHCVMSVREEVGEIAGVRSVDVDLASGRLTVAGEGYTDPAIAQAVAQAVAEAGYEVVA
jgi:copper ion binding protein